MTIPGENRSRKTFSSVRNHSPCQVFLVCFANAFMKNPCNVDDVRSCVEAADAAKPLSYRHRILLFTAKQTSMELENCLFPLGNGENLIHTLSTNAELFRHTSSKSPRSCFSFDFLYGFEIEKEKSPARCRLSHFPSQTVLFTSSWLVRPRLRRQPAKGFIGCAFG